MAIEYKEHVTKLQDWLQTTSGAAINDPGTRDWCTLDMTDSLSIKDIYKNFSSKQQNTEFEEEYNKVNNGGKDGVYTNKPIMYHQAESDALDGLAKMFVYRHQPRLKNYRDDLENKNVRTFTSLSVALARYALLKDVNQS